jgi:hypothetical protein
MVRIIVILSLLGSVNLWGQSQKREAGFDEVIWFGLDYTQVKFIGASDQFNDLEAIQHNYFRSWNELIVNESSKYDLKRAFKITNLIYALDSAIARSERRDMKDIVQMNKYELSENQVAEIVNAYADPAISKVGAIFVMETLNKLAVEETMWLAFFQVSTGQVFHTERLIGLPKGFGFRNYWAGGYYRAITELIKRK